MAPAFTVTLTRETASKVLQIIQAFTVMQVAVPMVLSASPVTSELTAVELTMALMVIVLLVQQGHMETVGAAMEYRDSALTVMGEILSQQISGDLFRELPMEPMR